MKRIWAAFGLSLWLTSCGGGAQGEADTPDTPQQREQSRSFEEQLTDDLVATHRSVVEECFGGFGKGVPYAAELTVGSDGKVSAVRIDQVGQALIPKEFCVSQHYQRMQSPPFDGEVATVSVKAGVKNDNCERPDCAEGDLPCRFNSDIRCSVVSEVKISR